MLNQSQSVDSNQTPATLWNQLTSFGLNPHEWLLQPFTQDKYFIQNRDDREFCLLGVTMSKNSPEPKWQQIHLISY
jgi:hypothetical protein